MGTFVITIPSVSIARELWRLGEPDLAVLALTLNAEQACDIGIRAGGLHVSGEAQAIWPNGPSGVTSAVALAAVEYFEGALRPCSRSRRLPEKSWPQAFQTREEDRWAALRSVAIAMDQRTLGLPSVA